MEGRILVEMKSSGAVLEGGRQEAFRHVEARKEPG